MKAPPGFLEGYVQVKRYKLIKVLHGLKQSPRAQFGKFTEAMKRFGYKQSDSDHTLFLEKTNGQITCLIIYVDDIVMNEDDAEEISNFKRRLFLDLEAYNDANWAEDRDDRKSTFG